MDKSFKNVKKIYFVGIKGIAMSALAIYAKEAGFAVCGSDIDEEFPSDISLKTSGINQIYKGFVGSHIVAEKPDVVIYTGAHGGSKNPEVLEAQKQNIWTLPHGKALGLYMQGKRQISVSGSHGKTTTSAMIATILQKALLDPSYLVGCAGFGDVAPGHFGKGEWFVAEADEYVTDPGHDKTPRFLWQSPEILVVTNIDYDHPDVYASLFAVKNAFKKLSNKVPSQGMLILSSDDYESRELVSLQSAVALVGTSKDADYRVANIHFSEYRTFFELFLVDTFVGEFVLQVAGTHNALNAAMAAVACSSVGVSWDIIIAALAEFTGTKRRFEKIGDVGGVLFYDDYAHHPHEIEATLTSARAWFPTKKIVAVFQPHTYSRTQALFKEFSKSFHDANVVIMTDIYRSKRETNTFSITGDMLAKATKEHNEQTYYAANKQAVYERLRSVIDSDTLVLFMGAGDIYLWGTSIVQLLSSSL